MIYFCALVILMYCDLPPIILQSKMIPTKNSEVLAPLLFGVLTIMGGLLAIGLPETTGLDLPETVSDANDMPL